jgi:hypothetical protein
MKSQLLKFGKGNAKLDKRIYTFSISSGHTCPFASNCLSKADRETGKITDGKDTIFRCFSASQESTFTNTRKSRFYNFDLLRKCKTVEEMTNLIVSSIPKKATIVRIHVAGDFFNQKYFDAWLQVAKIKSDVIFYAYTKSLPYWILRINDIPSNMKLNASKGGKMDYLIDEYNLKYAEVIFEEEEAIVKGLKIDEDDTSAFAYDKSFALLIHGTQPKGSDASKAVQKLKKKGKGKYNKETKKNKKTVTKV